MYQQVDEEQQGGLTVAELGGRVDYDVELEEKESWNTLVGLGMALNDRWRLDLEGGAGERTQVTGTLTHRF